MRLAVGVNSNESVPSPAIQRVVVLARAGRGAEAEALLRELVQREPASADAWFLLGATLAARAEVVEATAALRRAVSLRPDLLAAWRALGVLLLKSGQPDEALEIAPHLGAQAADLLNDAGLAFFTAGRFTESEKACRKALAVRPGHTEALNNLGNALVKLDRAEEAIACYRRVIAASVPRADAHANLAFALRQLGRQAQALDEYRRALGIDPRYLDALNHGGFVLQEMGRWDEAAGLYARALEVDPSSAYAAYNLSLVSLFRFDFATGWPLYEARYRTDPKITEERSFAIPKAAAEDLGRCKRLAVWQEQGIGDRILFATVLPELEARGIDFVLETDARLLPAFARSHPRWRVVSPENSAAAFAECDFHVPVATLAGLLRPSRESFANQPPKLLAADAPRAAAIKASLGTAGKQLVAISWRSSQPKGREALAQRKSAPLEAFRALSLREDVTLVDLQYGDTSAERDAFAQAGGRLARIEGLDLFNDLDGLLAAIEACELVVTTSNVTAHLAGALGRETWLVHAGAHPAFFYWMRDAGGLSLWYPSVEVVSAGPDANWEDVFSKVVQRLDAREAGK